MYILKPATQFNMQYKNINWFNPHFFYQVIKNCDTEERNIARQAYAGLLWSKQFYHYVIKDWLEGDPEQPPPPVQRKKGRNYEWGHLFNRDVVSMPDKWEYPWVIELHTTRILNFQNHIWLERKLWVFSLHTYSYMGLLFSVCLLGPGLSYDSVRKHWHRLRQRAAHLVSQGMVHASKWTGELTEFQISTQLTTVSYKFPNDLWLELHHISQ